MVLSLCLRGPGRVFYRLSSLDFEITDGRRPADPEPTRVQKEGRLRAALDCTLLT